MADWGGALGGAATGAGLGSMFGPVGTAIGGLGGGLLGLFGSKNKQPKIQNQSLLNEQQQQALNQFLSQGIQSNPIYQQGSSYLQNLLSGNPSAFAGFEAPYKQQFQQEIVPGIAERFAGQGTGAGALSSSALYNSLAQAGRNLSTDLAGLRSGLQMQALPQALGYAQQPQSNILSALGLKTFQPYERPGTPSLLAGLGSGISQGLGTAFGQFGAQSLGSSLFGGRSQVPPAQPG